MGVPAGEGEWELRRPLFGSALPTCGILRSGGTPCGPKGIEPLGP